MTAELSLDQRLVEIVDRLTTIIAHAENKRDGLTQEEIDQVALCEKELGQFVDSFGSLQDLGITRL